MIFRTVIPRTRPLIPTPARPDGHGKGLQDYLGGVLVLLIIGCVLDFGAVYPAGILALELGSALLFAGWLIASAFPGPLCLCAKSIYLPLLAMGAIVVGQLAFHCTAYWYASFEEALLWTSYLLLFISTSELFTSDRAARVSVYGFAVFGPLLALFALIQYCAGATEIYWMHTPLQGSQFIFGPYINRNHYAGIIEMVVPFAALLGLDRELRLPTPARASFLFGAALMFGSIFVCASRTGMCCAIVELLLLGFFWQTKSGQSHKKTTGVLALALVTFTAFALWLDPTQFLQRSKQLRIADEISVGRAAMDRDALHMIMVHPAIGFGLHTFATTYPAYRSFHTKLFINELHNDLLQVVVELGIIGGIALLVFLALLYRDSIRLLRKRGSSAYMRTLRTASLIGITGLLVHSFFDFNLHIPANAACFFVLCAWATNRDQSFMHIHELKRRR